MSPILLVLAGCAGPPAEAPPGVVVELPPTARLVRLSMMLRGVRPSAEELRAVHDDPRLLEFYVDGWLDDPRFGETVREIHDHAWRISSELLQLPASGSLQGVPMSRIRGSLLSAVPRLAERVVMDERPYTEIVTADWFVADRVVAEAWPDVLDYDPSRPDDEWQVVRWGDGRPLAGVLSDSGLWTRYRSPNSNFNRQRANALSRALLCHDFLEAETVDAGVVIDLTDVAAANDAITSVPGCVSCHQDLDPLASFFPFEPFWPVPTMRFPYRVYAPEHETAWQEMTGRPPGYFGLGGGDLADLGRYVADDPRFADCAARRFYGHFAQLDPKDVPIEIAAELQQVLVDSGFDAKALARAAALHPSLAASHATDPGEAEELRGYLVASPRQLARTIEALTGFRWDVEVEETCCGAPAGSSAYGVVELPTDRYVGYQVVGGGFDGDAVPDPKRAPSVTAALLQRRLAEHAAAWVVERNDALLGQAAHTDDPAAIRAQLAELHLRILGEVVDPDGPEVDETMDLWSEAYAWHGEVDRAWKVVLTAMLRDVRVATY